MKFFAFTILATIFCYVSFGQTKTNALSQKMVDSIVMRVSDLNGKVNVLQGLVNEAKADKRKADSTLEISIKTAESVINKQNNLINGFEVLYGAISLLVLVISFYTYFFNIRPLINRAERAAKSSEDAVSNLNSRMDNFNRIIESTLTQKFDEYEQKRQKERVNQIFSDLCGKYPNQRKLALEQISTIPIDEIPSDRVYQLFEFLDAPGTNDEERMTIVELLLQKNTHDIKIFFKNWSNVKPDDYPLIRVLIKYYTENGFNNYLMPVSNFIISHASPHLEFKTISGYLSSYDLGGIIQLANYPLLVTRLSDYDKKEICTFLNSFKTIWNKEQEITHSLLCSSTAS